MRVFVTLHPLPPLVFPLPPPGVEPLAHAPPVAVIVHSTAISYAEIHTTHPPPPPAHGINAPPLVAAPPAPPQFNVHVPPHTPGVVVTAFVPLLAIVPLLVRIHFTKTR